MKSLMLSVCLILFCLPAVGCADVNSTENPKAKSEKQSSTQRQAEETLDSIKRIDLWMSREEIRSQWGLPEKSFVHVIKKPYWLSEEEFEKMMALKSVLIDFYVREFDKNRYEVEVIYGKVAPEKGDHPESRFLEARWTPVQPVPLATILGHMTDLMEVCRPSCELGATSVTGKPIAEAYHENPTSHQQAIAELIWRAMAPKADPRKEDEALNNKLGFMVLFYLKSEPEGKNRTGYEVDWFERPIEKARFISGVSLTRDYKYRPSKYSLYLGTFTPGATASTHPSAE